MKIFLIGLPGSGKTYWVKTLAKKLKCGGYDLDNLVELSEEKTINEIFEEDGEAFFRKAEAEVLRWFVQKKIYVLATGGGTPCFHQNMDWMNSQGLTIWLNEPLSLIASRLFAEKAHRPLIKDLDDVGIEKFLSDKLEERKPYYSQAKLIIDQPGITEKELFKLITKASGGSADA